MSGTSSLPFELLHAEMVRYATEREEERVKGREAWKRLCEGATEADEVDAHVKLIDDVFALGNAETRLESLGFRVGRVLAEKLSREHPRLGPDLEIMKFVCKEFWTNAYGRQVDNLRTNHQDNHFPTLLPLSEGKQFLAEASRLLAFPTGILRGALHSLGVTALVSATVDTIPAVKFNVHIQSTS